MIVYRLSPLRYSRDLTGDGASRVGYRWNSKGYPMLYASESRSLSILEVLVHIPADSLPAEYAVSAIEISDSLRIRTVETDELPPNWKDYPYPSSTQRFGNEFLIAGKYSAMKIPSVIIPEEYDILINPLHIQEGKIITRSIIPFMFDPRLFNK